VSRILLNLSKYMQAVVAIRLDGYIDRNTLNKGGKEMWK
jgi:hypothetical protein